MTTFDPGFSDQSLRLVVRPNFGGLKVRVRLSNRFGLRPLKVSAASVAKRSAGPGIVPGSLRVLRFRGRQGVTLAAGQELASDPVRLRFRAFGDLAVSMNVNGPSPVSGHNILAYRTSYSTAPGAGDHTRDIDGSAFGQALFSWPYLSDIEVVAPRRVGAVVAFGDSLTEGFPGAMNARATYPALLAQRLVKAGAGLSVMNAGISGDGLVMRARGGSRLRPAAVTRLDADVLDQAGVSDVIVLQGTNDLASSPAAGAGQIIAVLRTIIRRLNRNGLRAVVGTLLPADTPRSPKTRDRVNKWIRHSGEPDAVIDFHAALRDPSRPNRPLPHYDSGDGLHLSNAGYRAMARAVPLAALRGPRC